MGGGVTMPGRASILAAALLLSTANFALADNPETPTIVSQCRHALGGAAPPTGGPAFCDQIDGLLGFLCPMIPQVPDRRNFTMCMRIDVTVETLLVIRDETVNDTFGRYLVLLPSRLPEPTPGPVPFVIEQLLDYVNEEFNGDDVDALIFLIVGDATLQEQVDRRRENSTSAAAEYGRIVIETSGLGGETDGLACTAYRLWSGTSQEALRDEWERTGGLPPFPDELFPAICTPRGVDISFAWVPGIPSGAGI